MPPLPFQIVPLETVSEVLDVFQSSVAAGENTPARLVRLKHSTTCRRCTARSPRT
ncbi:hypothetical protein ZHAS_00001053 [Anopheles sinensis]|uniref:Uncharacterized protein n=1 Tax=Anopheles sinensis TaxID=74873 RepID=A0A084VAY8_ANOSI|nr:hypothetical protein ZHAS_00001053 [Anopheles sinensis]